MTRRSIALTAMAGIAALLPFTSFKAAPVLVWNASESAPIGLYYVQPADGLYVATLVLAVPPEPLASSLAQAGYLPRGIPLLKRILAVPGQSACRHKLIISVDGVDVGTARERDRRGRLLPAWQGCRTIADDEVFLMNWDEPASLDSRYFGPIPTSGIVGRADPLWTFGER
jgi:conjugative transfer signal peptidase TraF